MKKCTALFIFAFAAFQIASAQASYTSVSYNKSSQPALMLELPYNEEISEGFIVDNLKKTGYDPETKGKLFWKQNKLNGFYIFKDVRLEGASGIADLYFKVDQKSKRQKDASVIYLLVGKGENSFVSSDSDNDTYTAAKKFLNGFVDKSAVYKHDLDIKSQEDVVKDNEKKLDKLKDNEKDMIKKIDQLQKDLKKNQEDQKDQEKKIEDEKNKLDDLKNQTIKRP
jgi:hypothetical protein